METSRKGINALLGQPIFDDIEQAICMGSRMATRETSLFGTCGGCK